MTMKKLINITLLIIISSCSTTVSKDKSVDNVLQNEIQSNYSFDNAIEIGTQKIQSELPENSNVAIIDFKSVNPNFSAYILEELYDKLINSKKFKIMERSRTDTIKIEINYQLSGEVDDNQIISIGKQLGANYIVTGEITFSGEIYRLRVFAIDIEKGQRIASSSLNIRSDDKQVNYLLTVKDYKPESQRLLSDSFFITSNGRYLRKENGFYIIDNKTNFSLEFKDIGDLPLWIYASVTDEIFTRFKYPIMQEALFIDYLIGAHYDNEIYVDAEDRQICNTIPKKERAIFDNSQFYEIKGGGLTSRIQNMNVDKVYMILWVDYNQNSTIEANEVVHIAIKSRSGYFF